MSQADRSAIRSLDAAAQAASSGAASDPLAVRLWEDADSTIREVSKCIVALSSDYYWESDADHRITKVSFSDEFQGQRASTFLLGKRRWETGVEPILSSWAAHREVLEAHQPFRDLLLRHTEADGYVRYISVSGMPRFRRTDEFAGYLGISRDVTTDVQLHIISDLEVSVMQLLAGTAYEEAVHASMRLICKKLAFQWGRYWEAGRKHSVLRLKDSTQTKEQVATREIPIDDDAEDGDSIVIRSFKTQQRMLATLESTQASAGSSGAAQKGIAIPLKSRSGRFGVLEFRSDRVDYPKARFSKFLAHLAAQVGIAHDRDQAIEGLRDSENRFASTFELAAIGLCHVGAGGRIIHVNRSMTEILGFTRQELLEKNVADITHPDDLDRTSDLIERLGKREIDSFEVEKRYLRKDGRPVWVRIKTVMKWNVRGEPLYHVSVVEDISARKSAEEKIEHMATHDELTGLLNRAMFNELLSQSVSSQERDPTNSCAVLFVDLDRFKNINDSLGHQAGDVVLKTVAGRIKDTIRESDSVARFGGDEFVVLLDTIDQPADAEHVARKILSALTEPVRVRNQECRVTASVGVAVCPEDGDEAQTLIRNADVAMYSAKQSGRNDLERFSVDLTPTIINRIRLETQLQYALERQEFRIVYQPRVDAKSGRIIGAEALLRWWNAELGTIPPVQFIPIAEDTGLIIPIGRWLLQAACEQQFAWRERGLRPIGISVNLSPKQFADPRLLDTVQESLDQAGMEPEYLELEITEGMLMADLERAIATATELRSLGVKLAIDDFGTGYSSLMQLKRFPLDTLKIDRSFIRDLPGNRDDRAISEAIIAMGKTLGVSVVAEGIENEAQSELLKDLNCDEFQGFLFGKPGHPDEVATLLRTSNP
jgi:diguanylate cyclase (GGDEF)-like protein/PAS domain S-box-containing protein